jgi:hypothetical protein
VDAIDRTGIYASGVLRADTRFCNDISHVLISPGDELSTLIVAHEPNPSSQMWAGGFAMREKTGFELLAASS